MPQLEQIIGACPLDCPDACSWIVHLEDGKPVRLTGNPDHPFTGKALCAKTARYLDEVVRPDRLLYPQKRVGAKGSGEFERISWDEAFETIADNLSQTIEQYGGEAIWPYAGSGSIGLIQGIVGAGKRLFHYLNASRHDPNICSVAGHVGMSFTTGSAMGMNPEDLQYSDLIILWATNTIETNQHLWPFIQAGQRRGAKLVVIDPIRTATAKRADLHLPILPGTDGALVLGLIHQLIQAGTVDESLLLRSTIGWEEFRKGEIQQFDLKTTADTCGVSEEVIANLVKLISERSPAVGIKTAMGLQQHRGGGQAARLLSCLPITINAFATRGGGLCYSTGPAYPLNIDKLCRPDLLSQSTRLLPMTRLAANLLDLDNPPVKTLFITAGNPVASNPDQPRVRKALSRDDLFTVVVDHFQTDTADYADLLLPGTMQTEHFDLHDSYGHLYLQWNKPVAEPVGESLSHTEIFRQIASAMNLTEPSLYASDLEMAEDVLSSEHPALKSVSLKSLQTRGWQRLNLPETYLPFEDSFATSSGKFQFTSEAADTAGHGRLPHFVPPRETLPKREDGSLSLISSANKRLLNSVFGQREKHHSATVVTLNPKDAQSLQLVHGDSVRVFNSRGEFNAKLAVSEDVRRTTAFTAKGLWPKHNDGNNVNATVGEIDADMGQGATFKDNRVWIEKAVTE